MLLMSSRRIINKPAFAIVALATIALVVAAILRGQHTPGHDELNFLETGLRMLGAKGNPATFIHGSLLYDLMAVLQGGAYLAWGLTGNGWNPDKYLEFYLANRVLYLLAGRLIVVMFAVALLVSVNRLAAILYSEDVGPLATALLGCGALWLLSASPLKEDVPASTLGILSMLVLFDSSTRLRTPARWALSGALCGAAIATKYSMVALVLVPAIVVLGDRGEALRRQVVVFVISAGAAFLVIEPFIVLDATRAISSLRVLHELQETGRRFMAPRYLLDFLPLGLGMPIVVAIVPAVVRILLSQDIRLKAIAAYVGAGSAACMLSTFSSPRYFIPLVPFICIIVAGELWRLEILKVRRTLVVVSVAVVLTWPANVLALKYLLLLGQPDTRNVSQAWIEAQVPSNSKILLEGTTTLEPTFAPALVHTAEWFVTRQQEARAAGTTGRIFLAAASLAAQSGRPRYQIEEKVIEYVSDLNQFDYVVLSSYDSLPGEAQFIVRDSDPDVQMMISERQAAIRRLEEDFTEVFSIGPIPNLRFDWNTWNHDFWGMWAAPLWSHDKWVAGPHIKVYRRSLDR